MSEAGPAHSHEATSATVNPLAKAAVHITGSRSSSDPIPPHARSNPAVFIAGGQGEWSLTTMSITPDDSASQSRSRLALPRIGGAHLKSYRSSGMSSAHSVR
jgi:hypothetical protein